MYACICHTCQIPYSCVILVTFYSLSHFVTHVTSFCIVMSALYVTIYVTFYVTLYVTFVTFVTLVGTLVGTLFGTL